MFKINFQSDYTLVIGKNWLLFFVLLQSLCYVVLKALINKWDIVNQTTRVS